ncbi:unnamed protein product, partial [Acidithrix sp. C25]
VQGNNVSALALASIARSVANKLGYSSITGDVSQFINSSKIAGVASGDSLVIVVGGRIKFDATALVVASHRSFVRRLEIVFLDLGAQRFDRQTITLAAGSLRAQMSGFDLDVQFYQGRSIESIHPIDCLTLLEARDFTDLELSFVPEDFRRDVSIRFGERYLEFEGIPYARIDAITNEIYPGVSFAEAQLIEEVNNYDWNLNRILSSCRDVIARDRRSGGFREVATALSSRWLASRMCSEPSDFAMVSFRRIDFHLAGHEGVDPFGDLEAIKSGFFGQGRDPVDFLVGVNAQGDAELFAISASMDISVLAKLLQAAASIRSLYGDLSLNLVVTVELVKVGVFFDLLKLSKVKVTLWQILASWREKLEVEVVDFGIQ